MPTFEDKLKILNRVKVSATNLSLLPVRILNQVFHLYAEEVIIEEFRTKEQWLEEVYVIQKYSFANLPEMENQPLNKFKVMLQIYEQHKTARANDLSNLNEPG